MNAFQAARGGNYDAFVTKLNSGGTAAVYSSRLGGTGDDRGTGIALDSTNHAYLTGFTTSVNFPTASPFQAAISNAPGANTNDAFVATVNTAGSGLLYSTYLGGDANDQATGIAVDSTGSAYVVGLTASATFPTVNPLQGASAGGNEAFLSKIEHAATNHPPVLAPVGSVAINAGGTATLTIATASDPELPAQSLTYSMDVGSVGTFDHQTRVFSWTPPVGVTSGTATTRVTDNGSPPLSSAQTVTVIVNASAPAAGSLTVINTAHSGPGTLRQAISNANVTAGSTPLPIDFSIPTSDPGFDGATFVIRPATTLPTLTRASVTINGHTQTASPAGDTNAAGPEIVLDGSMAGFSNGLTLDSDGNIVTGLAIRGFASNGIVISNNRTNNWIHGNYLGTDATGELVRGNGFNGVFIGNGATLNTVGTNADGNNDLAERNVLSGNFGRGVHVFGTATANIVAGNFLGTDQAGAAALANSGPDVLIQDAASSNAIGGAGPLANIVSFNKGAGVSIVGSAAVGNQVNGNSLTANTGAGLSVSATAGADTIAVTSTTVAVSGNVVVTYGGAIEDLTVNGLAGADTVTMLSIAATIPTTVDGGAEADSIAAAFSGEFVGDLTLAGMETASLSTGTNLDGTLTVQTPGSIGPLTVPGTVTAASLITATDASNVTIGVLAGTMTVVDLQTANITTITGTLNVTGPNTGDDITIGTVEEGGSIEGQHLTDITITDLAGTMTVVELEGANIEVLSTGGLLEVTGENTGDDITIGTVEEGGSIEGQHLTDITITGLAGTMTVVELEGADIETLSTGGMLDVTGENTGDDITIGTVEEGGSIEGQHLTDITITDLAGTMTVVELENAGIGTVSETGELAVTGENTGKFITIGNVRAGGSVFGQNLTELAIAILDGTLGVVLLDGVANTIGTMAATGLVTIGSLDGELDGETL